MYPDPIPTAGKVRQKASHAMNRILLTSGGYDKLDQELRQLKTVDRPAVIKAIATAREHGDLSENAEYHAAREQQSWIEGRIKELDNIIGRAEVVDISKLDGPVKFGATVELEDNDSGGRKTYQIVHEAEADISRGLLNINSPLARELIGKVEDDEIEVNAPGGTRSYTILEIRYC